MNELQTAEQAATKAITDAIFNDSVAYETAMVSAQNHGSKPFRVAQDIQQWVQEQLADCDERTEDRVHGRATFAHLLRADLWSWAIAYADWREIAADVIEMYGEDGS